MRMSIKEVRPNVYKVKCPVCGRVFYSMSEEGVLARLDEHLTADHRGEEVAPCAPEGEEEKEE